MRRRCNEEDNEGRRKRDEEKKKRTTIGEKGKNPAACKHCLQAAGQKKKHSFYVRTRTRPKPDLHPGLSQVCAESVQSMDGWIMDA